MKTPDSSVAQSQSKEVRLVWSLVVATAVLSLLYAIQYFLGSPIHLSVVSPIESLALDPGNTLIAAGAQDGRLRVWEVPEGLNSQVPADFDVASEEPWTVHELGSAKSPILQVGFAADGSSLFAVSASGDIRRWELLASFGGGSAARAGTLVQEAGRTLADADFGQASLATIGQDGLVQVWDLAGGQQVQAIESDAGSSGVVALSRDGTMVAAAGDTTIWIWDVQSGQLIRELQGYWQDPDIEEDWIGHDEPITALAFSPDDLLLASGSADTTIVFWDLETGEAPWISEGHWATVTTLFFDQDGTYILSGGRDNKVRNLRVAGGKSTASYEGHLSAVASAIYGPLPDTIISAGDDGTMRVWETTNQKILHMEWSRFGLQPTWGRVLAIWMLVSGILGLVIVWGLRSLRTWSHLVAVGLYLLGPIVVLGLPLFEVISYPLLFGTKLSIAWPLILLAAWYVALLVLLLREEVAGVYQAPEGAPLSEQIMVSQRTIRTRFGIFNLAVWIALLVILYSVLRRFNLDIAFMGYWLSFIMGGAGLTVLVSFLSIVLAVFLALLGALGRLSTNPIPNGIAGFYISLIRGTPLLVQIFIWYLGLPQLGIVLKPIWAGVLALGVNYGAYMTEIFRAGIQAIGKGQREAAQALGMSGAQTFRRVVLPQAFRIVIPPIGNDFIAMMKDSSLVYLMGVWELTFRAQKIGRQNFRTMETFIIAAAFYWMLTVVFQALQGKLEEYLARSERK